MKANFAPYLPQILPGVLNSASLSPSMGIAGGEALADLNDVLTELRTKESTEGEKKTSVNTDETEEKDVAI